MFGVNKKREEKERELEQALSSKQEEADQYAQKLTEAKGSMQAAWQEAGGAAEGICKIRRPGGQHCQAAGREAQKP